MKRRYDAPEVSDYGTLLELTSAVHLLLGHKPGLDLSFSSPGPAGAGGSPLESGRLGAGAASPTATGTGPDVTAPGGAGSAGPGGGVGGVAGGSHGASGAGGQLPFTGFAAAGAAAIGTGLAAAGSAIRRRLRRSG